MIAMPRALVLIAVATLVTALASRSAHAIGLCEDTPRRYQPPRLFSEATKTFAISATLAWCEEHEMDEVRGQIAFVELRDLDGKAVGFLSSARGQDAKRLTDVVGTFEAIPAKRLAQTLKQRGYVPLVASSIGASARCTVRAVWTKAPGEDVNGFPASKLALEVRAGTKRLIHRDVGLAARQRQGAEALRAHFLPKRAGVAVWINLPGCEGPPPGRFGPDDAGSCYELNEPRVMFLDAAKEPELAACFKAP
jgi:hypothetical protein